MKNFSALPGAVALAAAFASSLFAQPLPPVLITDSADPNFVLSSALSQYAIAEYYTTNGGPTYSLNGLTFTDNPSRLTPGLVGGPLTGVYHNGARSFTGADAGALIAISGGDVWGTTGINIENIPTTPGHSYLVELLFHDDYYTSTNGVGVREFNVELAVETNNWPDTLLMDHMDLAAMGAAAYDSVDVLVCAITNDCDGSALEVVLRSLAIDNPLISAFALLDVGPGDLPVVVRQPVSQTSYVGYKAAFGPCSAVGSGISSQKWQTDAGSPGNFYDLADSTLPDGCVIAGAHTGTLSLNHLTTAEAGNYQFVATNPNGSTTVSASLAVEDLPQLSLLTGPGQLNLGGGIYFAEFYGNYYAPLSVGGVSFVSNNARVGGNDSYNNLPYFGSSMDASNLAALSAGDAWRPAGSDFDFTLPTVAGRNYLVQFLFHDNAYANGGQRVFDVNVGPQGSLPYPAWAPHLDAAYLGAYTTNGVDVVLTYGLTNSDGTPLEVQITHGAADNPMISALIYADVTAGNVAPPIIVTEPTTPNYVFIGHTLALSATAIGTPLNYQWKAGPVGSDPSTFTNVLNGGNQWGANTAALTITNIAVRQQLDYQLQVSNSAGTAPTTVATTTLYPPPVMIGNSTNYDYCVLTNGPGGVGAVDYWRLNEPSGDPIVYDSGPGIKDGVPGALASTFLGQQSGPVAPDFPGFQTPNGCLQCFNTPDGNVVAPALNLNTSTVTLLAWINPSGNQAKGTGLMFSRQNGGSGPADCGLGYGVTLRPSGDYSLRYFWNGASVDSGLLVPQYQWSLVALVITPTNAAIYLASPSGIATWSQPAANGVCAFSNPFLIGNDNNDTFGNRSFNGLMDEVAVFARPLGLSEIQNLWIKATGVSMILPSASLTTPLPVILHPGAGTNLSCTVAGSPFPTMQWLKRPVGLSAAFTNIPGATAATLAISAADASTIGDYVLMVSNYNIFLAQGQVSMSQTGRVLVVQTSNPRALIGRWLTGDQSYADKSGFTAAGVHDGVLVGSGTPAWVTGSGNVPPGFSTSLYALKLSNSDALAITNTASSDSDYRLDYDDNIANSFSFTFWAENWFIGTAYNFFPYVSKNSDTCGWGVRRGNLTGRDPAFTLFTPLGVSIGNNLYSGESTFDGNANVWHHYVATYDAASGERLLYMDGVLQAAYTHDFGPYTLANAYHMVIGGADFGGPPGTVGRFLPATLDNMPMFDVRLYNYAVTPGEIQAMMRPGTDGTVGAYLDATYSIPVGQPEGFTVVVPPGATASGPLTVWVTNTSPSVVQFHGTTTNVLWVVFAQNGANTQSFLLDTIGPGVISLSVGNNGGLGVASFTGANVVIPGMIGHWITGAQSLADSANIDGVGAHDGFAAGGTAAWDASDRPSVFTSGSSLNLAGAFAMGVKGSSKTNASTETYYPTFDTALSDGFTCAFWAKGLPSTANYPWVTKYGDNGNANYPGWQIRQNGSLGLPSFMIRGTLGSVDTADTYNAVHSFNYLGSTWHHYLASYDSAGGFRKLYIDGVLSVCIPNDFGPMPAAIFSYLVFGATDTANANQNPPVHAYANKFTGKMYDLRMYNYALNGAEALAVMNAPDALSMRAAADYKTINVGQTGTISFSLPEGVTAATVHVNNQNPSVVSIVGQATNPFDLVFSSSTPRATVLTLTGLAEGTATIQFTASGLTATSVQVKVWGQRLVGRWFAGPQSLADYSGFTPAGTHDGVAYNGSTPAGAAYAASAPAGFPGASLSLSGSYGVMIKNSAGALENPLGLDASYQTTFDDLLASRFTIAFWMNAGASQGAWVGYMGKLGEGDAGYQVHRNNATTAADFVLRSPGSHNSDVYGNGNLINSTWHHVAAVWDGATGIRTLYVDGNVDLSGTGDFGLVSLAPNHHLTFGSEEGDSISPQALGRNGYLSGNLYDVRVYNYALSQSQINALRTAPAQSAVSLTSPPNNGSYTAPAAIPLSASVTTNGNTITAVNYYQGTTLIGTGSGPTWSATSTGLAGGAYDIYAVVSYSPDGINALTANSLSNHVTVNAIVAPVVNSCSYNAANGHLTISGTNTGGATQNSRLLYTDDLSASPVVWHQFTPDMTSSGTTFSFVVTNVTAPAKRFYKVQNY